MYKVKTKLCIISMRLDLYNNWYVYFYGHKYSIIGMSNSRYALFSAGYGHFLDFELVNVGFTYKHLRSIQPKGIVKGENYLCYEKVEQLEDFIRKLIIQLVENPSWGIQVFVPSGQGRILKSLIKLGISSRKEDGDYLLITSGSNTEAYSEVLQDDNFISPVSYDYEDDNIENILNITVKRRHKLNIDFRE